MRRYGKWAGNPEGQAEDPELCIAEVAEGGRSALFYQCGRKRKVGDLCTQHARMKEQGQVVWIPDEEGP